MCEGKIRALIGSAVAKARPAFKATYKVALDPQIIMRGPCIPILTQPQYGPSFRTTAFGQGI